MPNFANMYFGQEYYDCSFLIGSASPQIFKCHKSILQGASEAFKIMLFGKFSEASFGKDTPIKIDNVEPGAFHFAMRCIYGDDVDVPNDNVAVQVYLFAHQWQIEELKMKLEKHFMDTSKISLDWILQVYEMYKTLNNEDEKLDIIMREINTNIEKVLKSTSWLQAKEETVVAILASPILSTVNEVMLYLALVKWGKYTLSRQAGGGNAEDEKALRGVISKGLRFIRFRNMSSFMFAHIFLNSQILSQSEQLSIMRSMSLRKGNLMPAAFSGSKGPRTRKRKKCKN